MYVLSFSVRLWDQSRDQNRVAPGFLWFLLGVIPRVLMYPILYYFGLLGRALCLLKIVLV